MSASTEEDKKPSEHINIRVVGYDSNEVFFKIKRHTPLKKLMEAYCERQGKSMNMLRFLVDGERARPEQTPAQLDMEDGDQIEVMIEQLGGYRSNKTRVVVRVRARQVERGYM